MNNILILLKKVQIMILKFQPKPIVNSLILIKFLSLTTKSPKVLWIIFDNIQSDLDSDHIELKQDIGIVNLVILMSII